MQLFMKQMEMQDHASLQRDEREAQRKRPGTNSIEAGKAGA